MKIGVLTTHDSQNYGALLQAYAMVHVYRKLGHEAVLVDHRRDVSGRMLKWALSKISPPMRLAWFLNATGIRQECRRRRATVAFLQNKIGMTPYAFGPWSAAPADLQLDLISVGSDQVWNAKLNDPLDYLPGRIPVNIPVISYAASIGMPEVPENLAAAFRESLARMKAVSVREATAVTALAKLGVDAAHVVDPVVLAGREIWDELIGEPHFTKRICVYMLGIEPAAVIEQLIPFAERTGREIDFFVGEMVLLPLTGHGAPRLFKNLKIWRRMQRCKKIKFHLNEGPESFLKAIAGADAVITSSYHALVFSAIYGRNVRFVVPGENNPLSERMVRIYDYAQKIIIGPLLQPDIPAALRSLENGEAVACDGAKLAALRETSRQWLKNALDKCTDCS